MRQLAAASAAVMTTRPPSMKARKRERMSSPPRSCGLLGGGAPSYADAAVLEVAFVTSAARAPAAALFDLDGTLVDSERENVESVVLACRRLGAELTDDERRFVIGHSWNE